MRLDAGRRAILQAGALWLVVVSPVRAESDSGVPIAPKAPELLSLPSDPEGFWNRLRELGARVDEETARELSARESYTFEEAIALVARDAALNPRRTEMFGNWYARYRRDITRETLGITTDVAWEQRMAHMNSLITGGMEVQTMWPDHALPEYFHAWQAWLLAPRGEGRRLIGGYVRNVLEKYPHPSTVALCLGLAERLHAEADVPVNERLGEMTGYLSILSVHESREAVLAILRLHRLVLEGGYADLRVEMQGTRAHYSNTVIRVFSSRGYATEDEIRDDPEKWASREEPYVMNDRWTRFQPIIRDLLEDPEANGLVDLDIGILERSLAMMPDAPFPGGE